MPRDKGPRRGARGARKAAGAAKGKPRGATPTPLTLTIETMGRAADGLGRPATDHNASAPEKAGREGARPVAVPFSLPGERVVADVAGARGTLRSVEIASPDRIEPRCRHHGGPLDPEAHAPACGSCALQHWRAEPYAAWKRGLLVTALEREGIEAEVAPLVACLPAARRRLVLSARRTSAGIVLGFNAARSDTIVDIAECTVAVPAIVAALPNLRIMLRRWMEPGARARVSVLSALNGLDVRVDVEGSVGAPPPPPPGVVRLSAGDEVVHEREAPRLDFGGVSVTPPPGAFVQAVEAAEEAMAALVTGHLEGCRSALDLYAGSGTFALRLARQMSVHAVEGEAAPLAALDRGWRNGSGLRPVTTERRDLDRRPLPTTELLGHDRPRGGRKAGASRFDGIVLDPPRAGAEAQVEQIARSGVPRIAAVSCNPVTLARDLGILARAGYRIERVVPIDQFAHTAHLEAVALLSL